ncbi:MAG: SH3 domain-containing protein [Pseudomonadota bacterium]
MKKFIFLSFIFLGAGFYELSGGGDFNPEAAREAAVEMRMERHSARATLSDFVATTPSQLTNDTTAQADTAENVSRAALDLVSFDAAVNSSGREAPEPATVLERAPARDLSTPDIALAELSRDIASGSEQISLTALETVATQSADAPANPVVFEGQSVVASSLPLDSGPDIRSVSGTLVNMRSGPSTDFEVIDQLVQGTEVEIMSDNGAGWVELRPLNGGSSGWIAEFLLTGG